MHQKTKFDSWQVFIMVYKAHLIIFAFFNQLGTCVSFH